MRSTLRTQPIFAMRDQIQIILQTFVAVWRRCVEASDCEANRILRMRRFLTYTGC